MRERARAAAKHAARHVLGVARRAHEGEDGGSMVFGAITLFTLVLFTYLVYVIGMTSSNRMQLQGAADAAAYSGALVEAESLESIAFLNDGMAFVYYASCRYAIDAAVYGTLGCFYYHDYYQYEKGNIPQDVQDGPWQNIEMSVQAINPGAKPASDTQNPNYVPPAPQQLQTQTLDYGWALLGDDGGANIFKNRFDQAINHAANLLGGQTPLAKLWLQDIHYAERMIVAATPALVEKAVVNVAMLNGATWVGVSNDMDKAWRIYDPSDSNASYAGFEDGHESGTNTVSDELAYRYAKMPNPVDGKAQDYPDWFDPTTGQSKTPFSATRICWNKRDWEHSPPQTYDHTSVQDPQYSQYSSTPAGHWHARHAHNVNQFDPNSGAYDIFVGPAMGADGSHDYGHGIESGDDAGNHTQLDQSTPLDPNFQIDQGDTQAEPAADHHQAQLCPTCLAQPDQPTPSGQTYPAVTHTQDDAEWLFQQMAGQNGGNGQDASSWDKVTFSSGNGSMGSSGGSGGAQVALPRLLIARPQIFRAGVTVAVWAPCTTGLGTVFPPTSFGLLAIASAQVGLRTPDPSGRTTGTISVADTITSQKVTFSTSHSDFDLSGQANGNSQPMNFYLGEGDTTNPGARWGARLVPIARALSWVDDGSGDPAGSGLKNLLSTAGRWYKGADNQGNLVALTSQELTGSASVPGSQDSSLQHVLQELARAFDVSQPNAAQAFVH